MDHDDKRSLQLGEPTDAWMSSDVHDRARQVVLYTMAASQRHYQPLRKSWDTFFDIYTNQPTNMRRTNRIRSNIPTGLASEMVDTFVSDMTDKMTRALPYVAVTPNAGQEPTQADAVERLIQYNFDNMTPDMGVWPIIEQVVLTAAIFGLAPSKTMWTVRTIKEPINGVFDRKGMPEFETVEGYMGPVIEPIFLWDYFPHPHKVWADDPYPHVHLSFQSWSDLKALNRAGVYLDTVDDIPGRGEIRSAFGDVVASAMEDIFKRSEQRARMGWGSDSRLDPDGVAVAECECMFRATEDADPVRAIITIANGTVIRVGHSPLPTGGSCYQLTKLNHLPGQLYGLSLIQKTRPQHHVADVALNMWIQQLGQTVNKPKVLDRSKIESAQSFDDQPGNIIVAKPGADVRNVMREIEMSPVGNDVMSLIRYVTDRGEGVSGATELKQGRLPSGERTATASNIAFAQSSVRFGHAMSWVGATFWLPASRKMHAFNQSYLPLPYEFNVLGPQGEVIRHVDVQTLSISPSFVFMGPKRAEHQSLRIAQLENLLKVIMPLSQNPKYLPVIDEIIMRLADEFNVINLDRLKKLIGFQDINAQTAPTGMQIPGQPAPGAAPAPAGTGRQDSRMGNPANATDLTRSLAQALGG